MTITQIMARVREITLEFNPCNIRREGGLHGGRTVCNGGTPCCDGCRHLTQGGCGIRSANACKLWFCDEAKAKMPPLIRQELFWLKAVYPGKLYFRESVHSAKGASILIKGERMT